MCNQMIISPVAYQQDVWGQKLSHRSVQSTVLGYKTINYDKIKAKGQLLDGHSESILQSFKVRRLIQPLPSWYLSKIPNNR